MDNVILTPLARTDYRAAALWYADRDRRAADRFQAAVNAAVDRLRRFPEAGGLLDDDHRGLLVRRFPFLLVYRRSGPDVSVIAVAHTSRDPEFWQGR